MSDDDNAAEYVLGTLDAAERAEFAARLARDPAARAAVTEWERKLAPLSAAIPDAAPSAGLWERIERALPDASPVIRPSLGVIEGGVADSDKIAALRASIDRWRGGALAAGALAASLLIFIAGRGIPPASNDASSYVAVVNRGGDQPALIVRVDVAAGRVFVRPVAAEAPAGKSLELWYIDAGEAPKSMGVVSGGRYQISLPPGLRPEKATFAVTVEPKGGSPTGAATGPVIYFGRLIRE
jgi:anti-sigma-K factor RskA